jgi:hypothetical protein
MVERTGHSSTRAATAYPQSASGRQHLADPVGAAAKATLSRGATIEGGRAAPGPEVARGRVKASSHASAESEKSL